MNIMSILKIVGVFVIILVYATCMGAGWFFIYDVGIRTIIEPLYSLPVIPIRSFLIAYIIVLWSRTLYGSENRKSFDLSEPEPYGKMLSHILTIYMYVAIIGLFYYLC